MKWRKSEHPYRKGYCASGSFDWNVYKSKLSGKWMLSSGFHGPMYFTKLGNAKQAAELIDNG